MSDKPPVILQLLPGLKSGGVERGTIDIAAAIVKNGGKALVASSGGPMTAQLQRVGGEHIALPLHSKNPFTLWRNVKRIEAIIKKHQVDIVHARSRAPAWSGYYAAKHTGCRFMTTFHGTYNIQNAFKLRYNAIMTRGERVIAISNFIAEHIKKYYAVDAARLRIIPRSVDLKLFNPANFSQARMIALTKEWRLPEDKPLILCPGRITRWKGQEVLVRALAALPHRNFIAVILGDDKGHTHFRQHLEKLILDLNLAENIRIAGHTQNIVEAYMLAKIVISPSIEPEAFGRVMLEAQAMGRPVIATNHGGSVETVIPTVTGYLVTPGNVRQLTEAINHVLSMDDTALAKMGTSGTENAQRFSLEKMCDATITVYDELLG